MAEISEVDEITAEGSIKKETRDNQEIVVSAFKNAFTIFENYPEDQLTSDQQAERDLIKTIQGKTLDQGKISYIHSFTGEDGHRYSERAYLPVDYLITFLRERVKSGELSPEEETTYRETERVLHGNSQEYYRGRNKKEYGKKMARIQQETARITADPRLTTGDLLLSDEPGKRWTPPAPERPVKLDDEILEGEFSEVPKTRVEPQNAGLRDWATNTTVGGVPVYGGDLKTGLTKAADNLTLGLGSKAVGGIKKIGRRLFRE